MHSEREWRCEECGKLMGTLKGDRLHIRFARSHEYRVSLPAAGICRGCHRLNELREQHASACSDGKLRN